MFKLNKKNHYIEDINNEILFTKRMSIVYFLGIFPITLIGNIFFNDINNSINSLFFTTFLYIVYLRWKKEFLIKESETSLESLLNIKNNNTENIKYNLIIKKYMVLKMPNLKLKLFNLYLIKVLNEEINIFNPDLNKGINSLKDLSEYILKNNINIKELENEIMNQNYLDKNIFFEDLKLYENKEKEIIKDNRNLKEKLNLKK